MATAAAAVLMLLNPSSHPGSNLSSLPVAAGLIRPLPPSSFRLPSPVTRKLRMDSALSLGGAGLVLAVAASACMPPLSAAAMDIPFQFKEPANALSLPTWAIHISSVVEWVTAMALVWEYGEKAGIDSWKGLSWGMVPLLGGALCACTWHFFYNSESLEILVALQAALTVIGNFTMCVAAFRIYESSQGGPGKS